MTGPQQLIKWSITNRPDADMLHQTIKEAHLIDVTIPISFDLYSNIIEKLQQDKYLKYKLTRIWQLNMVHIVSSVLSTMRLTQKTLHDSLKLLNHCPGLYILTQKAVILNVGMFFAE
jgi:hypothetical protein